MTETTSRLFVYGTLLQGERDHSLLEGSHRLGDSKTEPAFELVDIGAYAAMVPGGQTAIVGEVYVVDLKTLADIDVHRQVPILFRRALVRLADGSQAASYLMSPEQVRGRRRLGHGDWRKRFAPGPRCPVENPFARKARKRQ
jgi:gamma-glutamylaminecyclotransferase